MRSCRDHHWYKTRAALHYPAIFFADAAEAPVLRQPAFLLLVAPRRISARAMSSEKRVLPDFLSAKPLTALSTAAAKTARSFAASQKAFERTAPSPENTAHRR